MQVNSISINSHYQQLSFRSKDGNINSDTKIKLTPENKYQIAGLGTVLGFAMMLPFENKINDITKNSLPKTLGIVSLGLAAGTIVASGIMTLIKMFKKHHYEKMKENGQVDKINKKLQENKMSTAILKDAAYVAMAAGDAIIMTKLFDGNDIKNNLKNAGPISKILMLAGAVLTPLLAYDGIKNNIVATKGE